MWAGYLDNRGNYVYNIMRRCLLEVGIPRLVVTDPAGELKGYDWKDILNTFHALKAHVETANQQQDYAELTIQIIKAMCRRFHNFCGVPYKYWTYVLEHAIHILNCTACKRLGYKNRHSLVFGETPDISAALMFMLWQKVRYLVKTIKYPKNPELPGRFLGIAWDVGDQLTFRILPDAPDNENLFVLSRSVVEADDGKNKICTSQQKIGIKETLKLYVK